MASNPNRSRDLLELEPMKIWMCPRFGIYVIAQPQDDKARDWMRTTYPVETSQYFGHGLAIWEKDVESFENKFIDAGGQLI